MNAVTEPGTVGREAPLADPEQETGRLRYDRRLGDKLLAAFNHAYAEGEDEVAKGLHEIIAQIEARAGKERPAAPERRTASAVRQADLWAAFVDARNAYRAFCEGEGNDAEPMREARKTMTQAYEEWWAHRT
jgi:hypothetical protein